jgi:hypothetical protein
METLLSWIIGALALVCLYLLGSSSYHRYKHKTAAELAAQRKAELAECGELYHQLLNQLQTAQEPKKEA